MQFPLTTMRIRPLQFRRARPITNIFGRVRRGGRRVHQGWDLDAHPGTPVYAIADGELTVGVSPSYGHYVRLKFEHGGRTYYAFYAHLRGRTVVGNSSVREGAVIGQTGRSGSARRIPAREAHLHFEIRTVARPGRLLADRIDPGEILGYEIYSSR